MDFPFSEIPGKVSSERTPTQYTGYYWCSIMVLYFGLTFEHCLILLKINSNRIEVVTIQSKSRNQSSLFTSFCSILQNDLNHQYGKIECFL